MTSLPKKILIHSILVASAISFAFLIAKTPLADFSLQISGLLVAVYMAILFAVRKKIINITSRVVFDVFVFSFAVSFLLFSTGGFTSPLFFLSYFLLFGIALLSAPLTSVTAALVFAILFVLTPRVDLWTELLQIASLLAIAPLSLMFGKQYLEILEDNQKIQVLKSVSRDFAEEIKSQEEGVKNWTEGEFRQRLVNVQKYLGELLKEPELGETRKKKINELYQQIYELFLSGEKMKKEVGK